MTIEFLGGDDEPEPLDSAGFPAAPSPRPWWRLLGVVDVVAAVLLVLASRADLSRLEYRLPDRNAFGGPSRFEFVARMNGELRIVTRPAGLGPSEAGSGASYAELLVGVAVALVLLAALRAALGAANVVVAAGALATGVLVGVVLALFAAARSGVAFASPELDLTRTVGAGLWLTVAATGLELLLAAVVAVAAWRRRGSWTVVATG